MRLRNWFVINPICLLIHEMIVYLLIRKIPLNLLICVIAVLGRGMGLTTRTEELRPTHPSIYTTRHCLSDSNVNIEQIGLVVPRKLRWPNG